MTRVPLPRIYQKYSFISHRAFVYFLLSFPIAPANQTGSSVAWKDALKQKPDWYATDQAFEIANNLLLYQRNTGGWPKNIDMAAPLSKANEAKLLKEKTEIDSTIDNTATYTQLTFLARVSQRNRLFG